MPKTQASEYQDLAPSTVRQRLVIEGYPEFIISDAHIKNYLTELSELLAMKVLSSPVTHRSDKFGWAGWIHWETSGAHFYSWEQPMQFFSVDIYPHKAFNTDDALKFTKKYFKASKVTHKSF